MSARALRTRAVVVAALIAPLVWNNRIAPALGLGQRGRTLAHLSFAAGYAALLKARPNWCSGRGLRTGLLASSVLAAGAAAVLALGRAPAGRTEPAARIGAARVPQVPPAEWIAVHIPLGTVLAEELVFRATLDPLLTDRLGSRPAVFLGSVAFGLWHIRPARAAGDPVLPTVLATSAAGVFFTLLNRRTGSTITPALVHFTLNAAGAVIATRGGVGSGAARVDRNAPTESVAGCRASSVCGRR